MGDTCGGVPKGIKVFGIAKVGEKGQVVIPKEARKMFDIKPGDNLLVVGNEITRTVTLMKFDEIMQMTQEILNAKFYDEGEDEK